MSNKPRLSPLQQSKGQAPRRFDRAGRVALIAEAGRALLAGRLPGHEAALFVGGALMRWLETGGELEKDYLEVRGPAGSHRTASQLWQNLASSEGQQESESADTVVAPSSQSESDE